MGKNASSNQQTLPTIPLPATDTSTPIASTEELFELFQSIFIQGYGSKEPEIFEYVQGFGIYNLHDKVTPAKEKIAIKMICKNKFEKRYCKRIHDRRLYIRMYFHHIINMSV